MHHTLSMVAVLALLALATACRSTRGGKKKQPPPPPVAQTTHAADSTSQPVADTVTTQVPAPPPAIDSAAVAADLYAQVMATTFSFSTFTGKAKVDYTEPDGSSQSATAQVRIARDSLIWLSLTGTLGIEGVRALIRPDSVFVMDKLKKTITYTSIDWLQQTTGLPFGFADVQNLLLGHPVFFNAPLTGYSTAALGMELRSVGDFFRHLLTFDTARKVVVHSKLNDVDTQSGRSCEIGFDGYIPLQGKNFSTKREIVLQDKNRITVLLDYKQAAFGEAVSFPFNIPRSYKVK